MRVGSPVIRSCWQADLQADQSPTILDLGSLMLQAVTRATSTHPVPTNRSKGLPGHHRAWGGGGGSSHLVLPEDMWSGQSWSRVGNYASNKIRDVLLFFSGKSHSLTRMIFGYGTAHYCCLCCFLLCSGQFVKSFRVSKASNVSSVTSRCAGFYVKLQS